jgi:hypothetical protein
VGVQTRSRKERNMTDRNLLVLVYLTQLFPITMHEEEAPGRT